ncbi:MAG: hypothetical protein U0835_17120 [Isosphaeraceae bacterium]
MWPNIGLGEWLFDFDQEEDVKRMPATALSLAKVSRGRQGSGEPGPHLC